jgi:hypothetical protein
MFFFSFFPTIVIPNTDTMQIDKTWLKVETFVEQKYDVHVQINFVCMIENYDISLLNIH